MIPRKIFWVLILGLGLCACSAGNIYLFQPEVQKRFFISEGDIQRPHQSLGFVQLTRKGAFLFGFAPVVHADLQKMFGELLIAEMEKRGADGIINMQFRETQYPLATKIIFAFPLFFIPLPTRVEVTGELIKFLPEESTPAAHDP